MQELTAQLRHVTNEQGEPLTFSYTLLAEVSSDGFTHYGIGIQSSAGDCTCLSRLTVDRAEAEKLLELAVEAVLSPHHLTDVVEDWLGQ